MAIYKGKIRIEGLRTAVDTSIEASNPSSAKKIIDNNFKVKHWVKQPTRY